jgi:hypothetical protein
LLALDEGLREIWGGGSGRRWLGRRVVGEGARVWGWSWMLVTFSYFYIFAFFLALVAEVSFFFDINENLFFRLFPQMQEATHIPSLSRAGVAVHKAVPNSKFTAGQG